jgi:hypothetical protein
MNQKKKSGAGAEDPLRWQFVVSGGYIIENFPARTYLLERKVSTWTPIVQTI